MGDFPIRSIVVAVFSAVFLFIAGCASNDDGAPVDVEKQAVEDLRDDIRNAVTDPAREAEAIRLVGVLEQDLADLRASVTASLPGSPGDWPLLLPAPLLPGSWSVETAPLPRWRLLPIR